MASTKQEFPRLQAVIRPGDHGRKSEQDNGHSQHVAETGQDTVKGPRGEVDSPHTGAIDQYLVSFHVAVGELRLVTRARDVKQNDHDGRHRADYDRVDKRFQQGNQALRSRVLRSNGRVSDGGRAGTRFVGEGGPLKTDNQDPDQAAESCRGSKSSTEYLSDRLRHVADVRGDDDQCRDNVDPCHERDDFLRDLGDSLDPTDDDDADQDRHEDPDDGTG